ncbi:hypothetical protein Baya_5178 [Bagarius yarrelli]|uniref:Uncharacterized protein n=1 Tax=Bagarius yarrelli TaxID=175774 RepID=A0A556TTS6_BAGYA|nr:hypothetical protein Baya_5178 [Bagarius yarrelli]
MNGYPVSSPQVPHNVHSYGVDNQYALGISVPERYCNEISPLDQNFLSQDDAKKVRDDMQSKNRVYTGAQLIAARPKFPKHQPNIHAEYLLLRDTNPSHMQNLLNKPGGGCAVFFTLNSPCVEHCSSPSGSRSIIPGLEMFTTYTGPKAFVFRQIYKHDLEADWESNLRGLNLRIPVYRCESNECVRCITNDDSVHPQCTAQ